MSWLAEGYEGVRKRGKQLEEQMNRSFLPTFMLREGEEADIRFITDVPITFYEHFVPGLKRSFTCSQTADCPLCGSGNKPSFRGAYLVIDTRNEEWEDKETGEKKSRKNTLKVMKHGIKALQVLDRKHQKKGLKNFDWNVSRTGSGTTTTYDFEAIDKIEGIPEPEELPSLKEVLAPREREHIIQQLAKIGHGTPGSPITVQDEDEGVVKFD